MTLLAIVVDMVAALDRVCPINVHNQPTEVTIYRATHNSDLIATAEGRTFASSSGASGVVWA